MGWKKINFKKLAKFIPVLGIILFIYMIYAIGVEKIANTFVLIPFYIYIIAFIPTILRIVVCALKWRYISKKQNIFLPLKEFIEIFMISAYYGAVTPGGFGWHVRIFLLCKKAKASFAKCITNSVIDTSVTYIGGKTIALIGTIVLIEYIPGVFMIFLILLIFYITVFVLFMRKKEFSRFFKFVIKTLIPAKYRDKLDKSIEALYEDIPRIRDLFVPFIYEIIMLVILGTQVYIIAMAFSVDISYPIFLLIHTISIVTVSILPISIGGLGVREGAFVFLLAFYGVKPEIAFVISLSGYLVKTLVPSLCGMFLSFKKENAILKYE